MSYLIPQFLFSAPPQPAGPSVNKSNWLCPTPPSSTKKMPRKGPSVQEPSQYEPSGPRQLPIGPLCAARRAAVCLNCYGPVADAARAFGRHLVHQSQRQQEQRYAVVPMQCSSLSVQSTLLCKDCSCVYVSISTRMKRKMQQEPQSV